MKTDPTQVQKWCATCVALGVAAIAQAQMIDVTQAPNILNEGIHKSLADEIGPVLSGHGDLNTPGSSAYVIARDPFRAIRRGRQLFQRKFIHQEGQGPRVADGIGDIAHNQAIGAGLSDSCTGCHGRPRGSAGFGGDVATRPDSRTAPHLFGIGLREMLADEITSDLRRLEVQAINAAKQSGSPVTKPLQSKGIEYGSITARPGWRQCGQ
jgi:hypothetical protein